MAGVRGEEGEIQMKEAEVRRYKLFGLVYAIVTG